MTVGGLACEAVGNATPGATTGTLAVALVGETDAGWLAGAASAEEAVDIVHRILPRAGEVWRSELLAWIEDDERHRDLLGAAFPASWTRH